MTPAQIIAKKRDGVALSADEIASFIRGFSGGTIPDYQMSALAMAIFIRGMNDEETTALTDEMLRSGTPLDWSADGAPKVDKHSTGGVGDKVSLILAPLLACCDLQVPMISGRGLGATGGTLDKLESIPGFRTDLSRGEIRDVTERVGCVITGATTDLAPADKKLYALRDVTATVASIPLITASIMSKKLSEGLDALVLDVKFGSGAFMKTFDDARRLAESMVAVGRRMNVRTAALLTDMNQPLGRMVGHAVEVEEAIAVLQGGGPPDLIELTLTLGAELLVETRRAETRDNAKAILSGHLDSGRAVERLRAMVTAQSGDLAAPRAVAPAREITAREPGFVGNIDAEKLGEVIIQLGGGRRVMTDRIDHAVGLEMLVRLGDQIEAGQPLFRLFAKPAAAERATETLLAAVRITDDRPTPSPLVAERLPSVGQ